MKKILSIDELIDIAVEKFSAENPSGSKIDAIIDMKNDDPETADELIDSLEITIITEDDPDYPKYQEMMHVSPDEIN